MNSKLPPKYTILFLLLFISITNKGGTALFSSVQLCPANTATTGEAFVVSASTSIVAGDFSSVLESYQWYAGIVRYI
ncbi:MAG: hypothetical protein DI539_06490 [Flavobacterium psychrophilum]|nr:MAG: hypothetical protein DI539_06490 [Flavobacterium psychrophilum]